ncbi:mitochondrial import inner membrane translocase subunit Tim29 [Schistocerca nitens]|uniref:mitochondrial import inner membrane translocase subunit Tim29 n=1 Tax=Schistocerca nitens TaxID=7011 RepID=UPI0021180496|nr:mitochondrial import inner membrane translocase subunit Tim29 [Schistocerca nitens]
MSVAGETQIEKKIPIKEKLRLYLINLAKDYQEATLDLVKDAKANKRRSFITAVGLGFAVCCSLTNPDEESFRRDVIMCNQDIMLVGKPIRNPASVQHMEHIESCYNRGFIRSLNLGLFSLIWVDNRSKSSAAYSAQCSYLRPSFFTFHKHVIDVGFLGRWWWLNSVMTDYDINPVEFPK